MRLQRFAFAHDWTVVGEVLVEKERFARLYADGVRVVLTREEGSFTVLICSDGQPRYVATTDWRTTARLAPVDNVLR